MVDLIESVEDLRHRLSAGAWRPSGIDRQAAASIGTDVTAGSIRGALSGRPGSDLVDLLGHVAAVLDLPPVHESTSREQLVGGVRALLLAVVDTEGAET